VQELRQQYQIAGLLKLAQLPRSTFYYQQKLLKQDDKYRQLKATIKAVFERHKGRYGYRRVTATVRQMGNRVNHKVVQRLMGTLGLKSLVRPKSTAPSKERLDRLRLINCSVSLRRPPPIRNG